MLNQRVTQYSSGPAKVYPFSEYAANENKTRIEPKTFEANTAPPPNYRSDTNTVLSEERSESDDMATADDLVDAKIAAAEARGDTKSMRLEGKLDLVLLKLDSNDRKLDTYNATAEAIRREVKDSERAVRANGWVIFAAISGLIVGVVAIIATVGPFLFEQGAKQDEITTRKVHEEFQKFIQQPPVKPQP